MDDQWHEGDVKNGNRGSVLADTVLGEDSMVEEDSMVVPVNGFVSGDTGLGDMEDTNDAMQEAQDWVEAILKTEDEGHEVSMAVDGAVDGMPDPVHISMPALAMKQGVQGSMLTDTALGDSRATETASQGKGAMLKTQPKREKKTEKTDGGKRQKLYRRRKDFQKQIDKAIEERGAPPRIKKCGCMREIWKMANGEMPLSGQKWARSASPMGEA